MNLTPPPVLFLHKTVMHCTANATLPRMNIQSIRHRMVAFRLLRRRLAGFSRSTILLHASFRRTYSIAQHRQTNCEKTRQSKTTCYSDKPAYHQIELKTDIGLQ